MPTYGYRNYLASRERAQGNARQPVKPIAEAPLVPAAPELSLGRNTLTIGEPKQLRDKGHLRFIASQPCLVCGRKPSDPHHLRFAQPRAIGLKVSYEFTVPLRRGHHRQLHNTGNKVAWREDFEINALGIAKGLWEQSHGRRTPTVESITSQAESGSPNGKTSNSSLPAKP